MKRILIGFLVVNSLSCFSQTPRSLKIINLTYPEQEILLECLDDGCSEIKYSGCPGSRERYFFKKGVEDDASRSRFYAHQVFSSQLEALNLTRKLGDKISKNTKEAYYGKAIGNSLLTPLALVADVASLPVVPITRLVFPKKMMNRKDKNAAERLILNLNSDLDEMLVKHKYFIEIKNYLNKISGVNPGPNPNSNPNPDSFYVGDHIYVHHDNQVKTAKIVRIHRHFHDTRITVKFYGAWNGKYTFPLDNSIELQ